MGGTYYIENLIKALNLLDDNEKPLIFLLTYTYDDYCYIKENTNYPYLVHKYGFDDRYNVPERVINKVFKKLFGKKLIDKRIKGLDCIFPIIYYSAVKDTPLFEKNKKLIYWIPDFQEKYYPELFDSYELKKRTVEQSFIAKSDQTLILSSRMAYDDFKSMYQSHLVKTAILNFAVHTELYDCDATLLSRYNVTERKYFFVANQFWMHKNHITVFKAMKLLVEKHPDCVLLCTGSNTDVRNAEYNKQIASFLSDNNLQENIRLLGFISKKEKDTLMRNSIAVIQPSLFEGWSTIVEEAKAVGKHIVLSEFPVHKEQVSSNCTFFSPLDYESLSAVLSNLFLSPPSDSLVDYKQNQLQFARTFLQIANE